LSHPTLSQALNEVHVINPLVEPSVGVAPVVGQLVVELEELFFLITSHLQAGVALGVDVVEHAPQRLAHRLGAVALRGDHDQLPGLPLLLEGDQIGHVGIHLGQVFAEDQVAILLVFFCCVHCSNSFV